MNIRNTVISFLLMLGLVLTVAAQEARTNDESISSLKQQLTEVEAKETQLRIRLEELDEQLKPECIERALAGIGSTHPEELREHRRKLLTIERTGQQILLIYENHNLRASARDFAINLTRSRSTLAMFQTQSQCVLLDVLDSSRTFTRKVIGIAVAPSIREAESDLRIMMSSDAATW